MTGLQLRRHYVTGRSMISRQRLRCTQRAVSPAHDIARLVRQGLAGVCTVRVLLVLNLFDVKDNGATLQRRGVHLSFMGINQVALRRPGYYWDE